MEAKMTLTEASYALLKGEISQEVYDAIRKEDSIRTLARLEKISKPKRSYLILICTYKRELGISLNPEEVKVWNSFCKTF